MRGKRKTIIISVVVAVILLVAGTISAVVVRADDSDTTTASPTSTRVNPLKTLADKVAGILNLDATTVEEAFDQAQAEIRKEQAAARLQELEARIDQMVTDGKLTEEQATKYKTWLESKPETSIPGLGGFGDFGVGSGFGGRGGHRSFGGPGPCFRQMPPPTADSSSSGTN